MEMASILRMQLCLKEFIFFKANPVVIEKLQQQKNLLSNGELIHSYPHSWRSKAPLVHRATPQWFISMESHKLREKALKAIDETTFYPNKGKERLKSMIETRPDWCVSRQRVWGVPLPIFINKKLMKYQLMMPYLKILRKFMKKRDQMAGFLMILRNSLGKNIKQKIMKN